MLTAYPIRGTDWRDEGADEMLVKPMNTQDLLLQIEALLVSHEDKKRKRAESAPEASVASAAAAVPERANPPPGEPRPTASATHNPKRTAWKSGSSGRYDSRSCRLRWGRRPGLLETGTAKHRSALRRLKGNRGLGRTL